MQNVAVFLDNLGVFFLTKNHQSYSDDDEYNKNIITSDIDF